MLVSIFITTISSNISVILLFLIKLDASQISKEYFHWKYDYEKACLISLRNVACHSIGITCCELILILYPQSETLNSSELMTTEIQGLYYLLQLSLLLLQVQILQLKQKIVTSQKKVMALFASTVPNRLISLLCWGTPFK